MNKVMFWLEPSISILCFQSLVIRCNSRATLPVLEQLDPLRLAITPLPTSPSSINDKLIKPLPIFGTMKASVATVVYRAPL